ncbi:hypothetical protein K440DRAFT_76188 [Wilcoxina mikolae CBS 423.85]|nr:hypothetical protein K440DRAFT_76188 [Wilcoxina mikolae CBS 423.85]
MLFSTCPKASPNRSLRSEPHTSPHSSPSLNTITSLVPLPFPPPPPPPHRFGRARGCCTSSLQVVFGFSSLFRVAVGSSFITHPRSAEPQLCDRDPLGLSIKDFLLQQSAVV